MSDNTVGEERCVHLARRGDQWAVRVGESWTECDLQEAEGAATTINGGVAGAWLLGWGARGDGPLVRGTHARSGAGLGAGSLLGHTRLTDTELETFNRDFVKQHKVYRSDLSPSYTLALLARLLGPSYLLHTFLQPPDSASVADQDEAELASIREEDEDSEAEDPTFECFEDEEDADEDDLQEEESDSEYWETDSADLERSGSDSDEEIIKEDINETIEDEEDIDSKRKCDSDTDRSVNNSKAGCSSTEEDKNTKRKYESGEEDDVIEETKKARTSELEAEDDEIFQYEYAIDQEDEEGTDTTEATDSDNADNINWNLILKLRPPHDHLHTTGAADDPQLMLGL